MAQRQTSKVATESIDSVYFSIFTDEEVRRYSLKKITRPVLFDDVGKPVPGGLYDPLLGPVTDGLVCKSCSQNSLHCPGHCGHIDLVAPVYNPLLFGMLHNLIRKICFFCQHFRLKREKVQAYVSQLDHIIKGDVVRALNIDLGEEEDCGAGAPYLDEEDGVAGASFQKKASKASGSRPDHSQSRKWTSLQYTEVRSVLNKFMKESSKTCENCGAKNPKITCPTFGWFQMDNMLDADIRANVIKGFHLDASFIDAAEQRSFTDNETLDAEDSLTQGNSTESLDEELSGGTRTTDSKAHRGKGEFFPAEFLKQRKLLAGPLLPSEVKDLLKRLWENEAQLCLLIFDTQRESLFMTGRTQSSNMFFIEALLVPPSKFRPPSKTHGGAVEHPQSVLLSRVVDCNISLGNAYMNDHANVVPRWRDLQQAVNILFDSKKAIRSAEKATLGISQLLEKKEGIFRQKMMGKRVNFACRSVISPDPFLAVNEIGIPPYFALRLTYPERVTPWNVDKLRHAIINGTEIHPGATHYADKSSIVRLPPSRNARIAISRRLPSSRGAVTHPGKSLESEFEGKVVYRHLQDGDIVLVNRQPTLHKPSIMAHVVRVLKGEKTLRMHYANCSTYNADFDGDEMNVHFPQDEISRAEAVNITNANQQYVVPTSGGPIRGLIQDHIISAVLLTKKDTFLNRDEYHQLLYASCVSASAAAPGAFLDKVGRKLCTVNSDDGIQPLAPAIWKPKPLWTGKQVITTILKHITRGHPPFTVTSIGKTEDGYFTKRGKKKINKPRVPKLLIRNNEFVHGVIDKSQFAKYGMVHTVQELYGSNTAGILLSVLSRLFTVFLQMHGFTCGVDDLLIEQQFDFERKMMLEQHENIGAHIHSQFIGAKDDVDELKLQMEIERLIRSQGETAVANLDNAMSGALNGLTSEVNKAIIPNGLLKPLTRNCLYLMTTTGAKGSMVNFTQISSMLGQQQLEGKRVPRMVSGKTLPCFPPWDWASRAGGFIADRFLTGLRPQEYYFHCMAGREGLVDTAIKTSRSGYLQRCLVKSLESLRVCYDHTVRDADGSVVQFFYGEDGIDVHKTSFITKFKLLAVNQRIVLEKLSSQLEDASSDYIKELPDALKRKAKDYFSSLTEKQRDSLHLRKQKNFMKLVKLKYFSSLAEPGEAVGVIAAQSVGEPSTQMTLNTFHHAGRGEMNVTLGIPRLQEILQRASNKIQTPVMTCPLHMGMTRIPLPQWVLEEMDKEPDLAHSDRFGRRNREYISLGCDILPVLRGRSPIQAYSDFMRNFRDTFRAFLGFVITGIQVGMGPGGELRYPSCPSEKLSWAWRLRELGEFQCYDKCMLASLNACAQDVGMREWGNGGPLGAGSLMQNPEETSFFRSDGSWNTPYGHFFLEWYSGMLLLHGERLCMAAETIFWSTGVKISAKVAGIHWHYGTKSHPSELTAGYYNTSIRDGYLPIARMLGRHRMILCCTCFDVEDREEVQMNPNSSPEGFLRQLIIAARMCGIPVAGENSVTRLDEASLKQVIKSSKLYSDGVYEPSFSFNFVRMNKNLFDAHNWNHFTRFVRQMSDPRTFRAKLDFGRSELCFSSTPATEEVGVAFAYC